jgi:hypothetical protein
MRKGVWGLVGLGALGGYWGRQRGVWALGLEWGLGRGLWYRVWMWVAYYDDYVSHR